jgi:flagellar protein FliT
MAATDTSTTLERDAIAACLAVESTCVRMLEAARVDDWDRVASLQATTEALLAGARSRPEAALAPAEQREKLAILRRIVILDGEIRRLREPWQGSLERLLAHRPAPARRQPACP